MIVHASETARPLVWDGGIRPEEMHAFLAEVEAADVNVVIESGRGKHAYSTRVLAEYQKEHPWIKVYSIDWEQRFWNRVVSRWRLRRDTNVELIRADAMTEIPDLLTLLCQLEESRCVLTRELRVALLIDGPKGASAVELLSGACERFSEVRLVALHGECREFAAEFPEYQQTGRLVTARP